MTVLSRGARVRRGGRRPGWVLLTTLLVLAIAASSALVFTDRVELLKLAVILALWAAVAGAFVSVLYRRQAEADQARARDMKLVYDLQLDREISARREYELTVESQLRRELASELRAEAADEVAALRAELAALRANLEFLFDADLSHRPAIETDRSRAPGPGWAAPDLETTGRVSSSRIDARLAHEVRDRMDNGVSGVAAVPAGYDASGAGHVEDAEAFDEVDPRTEESPIIDVPAEPHPDEEPPSQWAPPPVPGGAHRRPSEPEHWEPAPVPPPSPTPEQTAWPTQGAPPMRESPAWPNPSPYEPARPSTDERGTVSQGWQPVEAEGQWIPAGAPGSNWVSPAEAAMPAQPQPVAADDVFGALPEQMADDVPPVAPAREYVGRRRAPDTAEPAADDHPAAEPAGDEPAGPVAPVPVPGRHSVPSAQGDQFEPESAPAGHVGNGGEESEGAEFASRHGTADDEDESEGQHTGGQSVAELLARLQAGPASGGRRRRRED